MNKFRSLVQKYAFERYLNSGIIAGIDLLCSIITFGTATACTDALFNTGEPISLQHFCVLLVVSAVAMVISILATRTHRIIIRHSTFSDIWRLAAAVVIKELLLLATIWYLPYMDYRVEIILILFDTIILFVLMVGIRLLMLTVYEKFKQSMVSTSQRKNVFIYGIEDKATALRARLRNSPHYHVLGYIYPNKKRPKDVSQLAGLKIYGFTTSDDVQALILRNNLNAIIFPTSEILISEKDNLVKICSALKLKTFISPAIDEVIDGKIMKSSVREIKIEDLLGREEIKISIDDIKTSIKDKVILVTGAAGSIGSELCRQLATFGTSKIVMFDNAETPMHNIRLELEERFSDIEIVPIVGDVRHEARLEYVFSTHKPQIVFHAAAYKHVPLMEENPCEAVYVNVGGSRNVADMCVKHDVEMMVMISTDKAVNPTNIMGCTKRLAEIYVQSLGEAIADGSVEGKTKFVTTRFGNVLGSNGSVIPRFREQIMNGGPVTVTHPEITRFFMTIPEACRLVMEAAIMSEGNQIFVFDMGESVKIVTLAQRMIELAGFEVGKDIQIAFTGLRPGEKLYEEVLSDKENTTETPHEKIRIAHVRKYDYNEAVAAVEELKDMAINIRIDDMVQKMKSIVPEFRSKNSRFEKFDK